jgi:hypothetical protein
MTGPKMTLAARGEPLGGETSKNLGNDSNRNR